MDPIYIFCIAICVLFILSIGAFIGYTFAFKAAEEEIKSLRKELQQFKKNIKNEIKQFKQTYKEK